MNSGRKWAVLGALLASAGASGHEGCPEMGRGDPARAVHSAQAHREAAIAYGEGAPWKAAEILAEAIRKDSCNAELWLNWGDARRGETAWGYAQAETVRRGGAPDMRGIGEGGPHGSDGGDTVTMEDLGLIEPGTGGWWGQVIPPPPGEAGKPWRDEAEANTPGAQEKDEGKTFAVAESAVEERPITPKTERPEDAGETETRTPEPAHRDTGEAETGPACTKAGPWKGTVPAAVRQWAARNAGDARELVIRPGSKYWRVWSQWMESHEEAKALEAALLERGVKDTFVPHDKEGRAAVALGVYGEESNARGRVEALGADGMEVRLLSPGRRVQLVWNGTGTGIKGWKEGWGEPPRACTEEEAANAVI